jgi:hypothetical protein
MPNALTRVPERPVPQLPAAVRKILPVADVFMVLMVSRPSSGTLRDTWVTPATLWLSLLSALALLVAAGLLFARAAAGAALAAPAILLALLAVLLAAGCLSVVAVAIAQRTAR